MYKAKKVLKKMCVYNNNTLLNYKHIYEFCELKNIYNMQKSEITMSIIIYIITFGTQFFYVSNYIAHSPFA